MSYYDLEKGKVCTHCNQSFTDAVNLFFLHHRGICSDGYHAQVWIREGYDKPKTEEEVPKKVFEWRPKQEKYRAFFNRPSKPRPIVIEEPVSKVVEIRARTTVMIQAKGMPLCVRGCGNEVFRRTHKTCQSCISKQAQELVRRQKLSTKETG